MLPDIELSNGHGTIDGLRIFSQDHKVTVEQKSTEGSLRYNLLIPHFQQDRITLTRSLTFIGIEVYPPPIVDPRGVLHKPRIDHGARIQRKSHRFRRYSLLEEYCASGNGNVGIQLTTHLAIL